MNTRRENDRRESARFEILGSLRGSAVGRQQVQVQNIGARGALIETFWPLPVGARVTLRFWALEGQIDAKVLHVRSLAAKAYLIGLEFINPDVMLVSQLDGLHGPS